MLSEKTPLEWFREGKLGMIAGFRDLVPELRPTGVLDFDVMPMPVVDDAATVGDLTGICIARDTADVAESADFLVDFISTESVSAVAAAGYLAPANTKVALSDAFLQVGRAPVHSGVFNNSIRNMRIPPLLSNFADLEAAVSRAAQAADGGRGPRPRPAHRTDRRGLADRARSAGGQSESPSPSDSSDDD